ncbi:MAG: hypothetical protein IH587_13820 [Anaerolineae bacterium]|nr:hypothetical protein [Anaerolineae bacterium]
MMDILRLAWQRFSVMARILGDMQGRVIATIMYFTVILPFGLLMQLSDHPFKNKLRSPHWEDREPVDHQLEAAKRQG